MARGPVWMFLTSLCDSYPNNGKVGLGVNGTEIIELSLYLRCF